MTCGTYAGISTERRRLVARQAAWSYGVLDNRITDYAGSVACIVAGSVGEGDITAAE